MFYREARDHWLLVDTTVAGEERHPTALRLISPALKKQAGLDQVGSILDAVKGMNAKALASLVVMINASDMAANEEGTERGAEGKRRPAVPVRK